MEEDNAYNHCYEDKKVPVAKVELNPGNSILVCDEHLDHLIDINPVGHKITVTLLSEGTSYVVVKEGN